MVMKYFWFLPLTFLLLLSGQAFGQYGNDWFNLNQQYYKLKVYEDGVYQVSLQDLGDAGMPIGQISNLEYRMFVDGKEIPIYVTSNYIEFYGEKNDGVLDQGLYDTPEDQAHQEISLYSDTSIYFLTHTPGENGLRFRDVLDQNVSGKTEVAYHDKQTFALFPESFYHGKRSNPDIKHSKMNSGEGLLSASINRLSSSFRSATFDVTDFYDGAGYDSKLQTLIVGTRHRNKSQDIFQLPDGTFYDTRLDVSYNNGGSFESILDDHIRGYDSRKHEVVIKDDWMKKGSLEVKADVNDKSYDGGNLRGQIAVSHFRLSYPAEFNMLGNDFYEFNFENASIDRYISVKNFSGSSHSIYDVENALRFQPLNSSGDLQMVVPQSFLPHKILVSSSAAIKTVKPSLYEFNDLRIPDSLDYVIISHSSLAEGAKKYQNYRESQAGGAHKTLLVFTDDLYNQFYYGIHHSLAIKQFLAYLVNQKSTPKNVFLLGKGISIGLLRQNQEQPEIQQDLVPAIGYPPSDWYYGVGILNNDFTPPFGIGRLAARTNDEITTYLEKVKVYESTGPAIWRKNWLHIGGGNDEGEIVRFRQYLEGYEKIVSQPSLGARIYFLGKSSQDVVEDIDQSIVDRIDNGVGFFSYFGHASSNILEINIGDPNIYNNATRPMIMYFSGCVIGNCFDHEVFLGENYLSARTGAVNWIAPSHLSLEPQINAFTTEFYSQVAGDSYGKSVGEVLLATLDEYTDVGSESSETQSLLNIIQGDPANKIYSPEKPDYLIRTSDVFITPEDVTAQNDTFTINVTVRNQGKAIADSFDCRVKIFYPDNSLPLDTTARFPAVFNNSTIAFDIDNIKRKQFGQFKIEVELDPNNLISEWIETNNKASFEFTLLSNGAAGIFPVQYGIVADTETELTAQSLDPNSVSNTYYFEIDTTENFDSPWKQRSGALSRGQLAKWKVNLLSSDTQAYYWRVRLKLSQEGYTPWRESSFSRIKNSPQGWAQVEFNQMSGSEYNQIKPNAAARKTEFTTTSPKSHFIWNHGRQFASGAYYTYGNLPPENDNKGIRFPVGNGSFNQQVNGNPTENGVICVVVDPFKLEKFTPTIGGVSHTNGEYEFDWMTSSTTFDQSMVDSFIKFLDLIPQGYHLFIYSGHYHHLEGMKNEKLYKALEGFGSRAIRGVRNNGVWCMIGQKGLEKGEATEDYTEDDGELLVIEKSLGVSRSDGSMRSTIIGPAKKWRRMEFVAQTVDGKTTADAFSFSIYGIDVNGNRHSMGEGITNPSLDISYINAAIYPLIQLELNTEDLVDYTPTQIDKWLVHYDYLPDGMINSEITFKFNSDTLMQGDDLNFEIAYQNISNLPLEDVVARFEILDDDREQVFGDEIIIPSLEPGDYYVISKNIASDNLIGQNRFRIRTNPDFKVPELYTFNNSFERVFHVDGDKEQPLVDVTFDGYRILNGDIVSPSPVIKVSGKDNNVFYPLNDASYFDVTLEKQGESGIEDITVDRGDVTFYPASEDNNEALFEFSPEKLEDGMYTLSVQLTDRSGNSAGKVAYEVNFEVVGKSSVTHFYPYPNPFSTEMRFVFTLTGDQLPDEMLIQIMTVSGKIVKEIDLAEFGDIKIGNNISTFTWNGTDEFGNQLANGVYLYRVKTAINRQQIEHRTTTDDASRFKEGFGKIYILR